MIEIIKGSSVILESTVYSYWSGSVSSSITANLAGAIVKCYVKKRDGDSDANALLTINGTVTDTVNAICQVIITAAQTNGLSYPNVVFEIVVKLADGSYLRTGVEQLIIKPNVGKTLF
jgi:hypothetical protein